MTLPTDARLFALVPAAGSGTRMGASLPKQYLSLRGRTLAEHTMGRLLSLARIETVAVAVADADPWWPQLPPSRHPRVRTVTGGDSRARSVLNGLRALSEQAADDDWVLVHDMARPCVRLSDIERLVEECDDQGAILAVQVTDTVKQADEGHITATLDRDGIWRALTPQLFPLGLLRGALATALENHSHITDEASAVELAGKHPRLVAGRSDNIKVTLPEDLALADFFMARQEEEALRWAYA